MIERKKYTEVELDFIFQCAPMAKGLFGLCGHRQCPSGRSITREAYGKTDDPFGWEVGHITPIAKGGTNDPWNLQAQSISYNRSLQDRTPLQAFLEAALGGSKKEVRPFRRPSLYDVYLKEALKD